LAHQEQKINYFQSGHRHKKGVIHSLIENTKNTSKEPLDISGKRFSKRENQNQYIFTHHTRKLQNTQKTLKKTGKEKSTKRNIEKSYSILILLAYFSNSLII
jgi:hypothetical protein